MLVAKQLIPKGTPGTLVASQSMYAPTTLPRKEVEVGAIADPSYLSGRAASADIFPGQQFTATDFAAIRHGAVDTLLRGTERAISISLDNVHGSSLAAAGRGLGRHLHRRGGVVKLFRPNVKVLAVPGVPGPSGGGNLMLEINTGEAAQFAFAADNTQLWFVLRPVVGAKPTKPSTANSRRC